MSASDGEVEDDGILEDDGVLEDGEESKRERQASN